MLEAQYLRAQRMESIGTLAGGIAHDLNNVLAPILMGIEMLKREAQNPAQLKLLGTIETSTRRAPTLCARCCPSPAASTVNAPPSAWSRCWARCSRSPPKRFPAPSSCATGSKPACGDRG